MEKSIILFLFIITFVCLPFNACQNGSPYLGNFLDKRYTGVNILNDIVFEPTPDGILQVVAHRSKPGMDSDAQYSCGGSMYGTQSKLVNAGPMEIGDIKLEADKKRNNIYGFDGKCDCEHLFGRQVDFKLGGVPNPMHHHSGFVDNLYVPEEIYILQPSENQKVSAKEELIIKWNPDKNKEEDVMILSVRAVSPINVIDSLEHMETRVAIEDSGTYTLTQKELGEMPLNSKLAIKLIRGNYNVVIGDDFSTYSICGFAYAEGVYDLIP